jgi:hypothetical protein
VRHEMRLLLNVNLSRGQSAKMWFAGICFWGGLVEEVGEGKGGRLSCSQPVSASLVLMDEPITAVSSPIT